MRSRWNERFAPAFSVDSAGDLVLELQKVGRSTIRAPERRAARGYA